MALFLILLATILISSLSLGGGLLFIFKKGLADRFAIHLLSFAAGTLLAVALLDLLPEAVELSNNAELTYIGVIIGVTLFFFAERYLLWFHHHDELHGLRPVGFLVLVGDSIHNLVDGVAIGITFLLSPSLGLLTSLAVIAHEIPQELADLAVLLKSGFTPQKALIYNFISGASAILGGLAALGFAGKIQSVTPQLLAFTAGMFIYIAASDLIPELHLQFLRDRRWHQATLFLMGMAVVWILGRLIIV